MHYVLKERYVIMISLEGYGHDHLSPGLSPGVHRHSSYPFRDKAGSVRHVPRPSLVGRDSERVHIY